MICHALSNVYIIYHISDIIYLILWFILYAPHVFKVTLISEKFSPDLTSNVAAGIFLWGPKAVSAATDLSWATDSWSWWQVRTLYTKLFVF